MNICRNQIVLFSHIITLRYEAVSVLLREVKALQIGFQDSKGKKQGKKSARELYKVD